MPLPNPGMNFTPYDPLPASDLNNLVENIESLADGSGFDAGAIDTADLADASVTNEKLAGGVSVQTVSQDFSAVATGTTTIPYDDTIPQNTEGTEFMTIAITPKSATNILVVEAVLSVSPSAAGECIAALFQDTTANALAAYSEYHATAGGRVNLALKYRMAAGTTSSTTFKIRAGMDVAGTMTFNGVGGARRFGAITKSSISITEYKA